MGRQLPERGQRTTPTQCATTIDPARSGSFGGFLFLRVARRWHIHHRVVRAADRVRGADALDRRSLGHARERDGLAPGLGVAVRDVDVSVDAGDDRETPVSRGVAPSRGAA